MRYGLRSLSQAHEQKRRRDSGQETEFAETRGLERTAKAFDDASRARLRDAHIAALPALLKAELEEHEADAFEDMLRWLNGDGARARLSEKQRAWVHARLDQLEIDWVDPAERNRSVPRGAEVPVPEV